MEFEQPLTERMRTFLRIEFLYQQALFHARDLTGFGARAAIASLLEILAILSRGDIRSEVLKELERHAAMLMTYSRQRDVDLDRVQALLRNVDSLRAALEAADVPPQPIGEAECRDYGFAMIQWYYGPRAEALRKKDDADAA